MMRRLRACGAVWYDFVVGDDWTVAVGVVAARGFTYLFSRTSAPAWGLLPFAGGTMLAMSLYRAVRRSTRRQ